MKTSIGHAWPTRRLRFLARPDLSAEQRQTLAHSAQATFLPMESIGERGELDCSIIRDVADVDNGYNRFFDGDVLVAKITPCFENGKGALVRGMLNGLGFGTTELHVLSPSNEIDARYLYYVTVSGRFRGLGEAAMFGAAGQKRVPLDFVRDYRIPIPPLARQRAIADYLDRETGRMDNLVATKQRVLELLTEKRQAVISYAISHGVKSEEPLRDSESPWFGKVHENWPLKPLRVVADSLTSNVDKHHVEGELPVRLCNYVDVYKNEYIHPGLELMRATASEVERARFGLLVGDVVVTKDSESWEDIGVPALVTETAEDLVCGYHLTVLRPKPDVMLGRFLFRLLQARPVQAQLEFAAKGMTRFGLAKPDIKKTRLPVPPLSTQAAIADHLDGRMAQLDDLSSATIKTIELLKERRIAVISSAVAGNVAVEDGAEEPK